MISTYNTTIDKPRHYINMILIMLSILSIFMIIGYIFDDIHRNIWLVELLILCSIIFILIIIRFIVNIINYRKYRKICVDYVL
jgi:hypothetical protein